MKTFATRQQNNQEITVDGLIGNRMVYLAVRKAADPAVLTVEEAREVAAALLEEASG